MSDRNASLPAVNADFIIDLYHRYIRDPRSVDPGWKPYFDDFYGSAPADRSPFKPGLESAVARLIEAYRQRGHFAASLDPLGLWAPPQPIDLTPAAHGIHDASLDATLDLDGVLGLRRTTVHEVIVRLREAYAGSVGFDCAHVEDYAAHTWLREVAETGALQPDRDARRAAAARVIEADTLEQFMNRRFIGKKRFGAEGAEGMLPWFDALFARSAELGVQEIVIGGTARGRLNVMANIIGKPLGAMFYELKGNRPFPDDLRISGDVPYHFGHVGERGYGGRTVRIIYCNNPSHLEAIDAVALGRVRARQQRAGDEGGREVLGLLVHTDAAFAGQGVVAEVLQLSRIPAYATGGTIHLVINNQLGFTTDPQHGRSSTFCTDVAKTIGAPVLHVNADDVDAIVRVAWIAAEYRHRFHGDIIVDLVCYRRRGHNEVDEPSFTQPRMYRAVAEHPTVQQLYLDRLCAENVMATAEIDVLFRRNFDRLDGAYEVAKSYRPNRAAWLNGADAGAVARSHEAVPDTGLPLESLREIGVALARPPRDIVVNPKIMRQLGEREEAIRSGDGVSWALGEALAYASLGREGVGVRLSGQDTPRGAFSQRHFILVDQETGVAAEPFNRLSPGQGPAACAVIGSPLSEYAVLGFEYGYSLDAPESLVVWEAQFGDFANVAQVIIDQFVASGEDKWLDRSGMVLLLPHGLEGQGPDHSSGRIERFLQLCAGDNLMVANCTTPANFFHLLRRQARGAARRPLVVFTPKSLLRHKHAVSTLKDFGPGTAFAPVIGAVDNAGTARRVVLCSGKIYYDLAARLREMKVQDVAVVRVEQLHPFPATQIECELRCYPGAHVVWCQEEPRNMGPWSHLDRRIERVLRAIGNECEWPTCFSRPENASTAIGTTEEHDADQAAIVAEALGGAS